MSSIAEAIALAAPSFTGQLLRPTDHAYDDRRRVHNGLIDKRPAAIASLSWRRRHRRCRAVGPHARPRGVGTRRRSQRRGPGNDRPGPDDRSVADEGHSGGRVRAHGARTGRRPVERAQPRDTAAWTRDDRWRRREHRDRRPDARRRSRLADAEVRPRARQPAGRRHGDGRRPCGSRKRRREPGSLLGDSRRWRQLRHRRVARVHACTRSGR